MQTGWVWRTDLLASQPLWTGFGRKAEPGAHRAALIACFSTSLETNGSK